MHPQLLNGEIFNKHSIDTQRMQTSKQKKSKLKNYEALTFRGQVRRLREMVKSALGEFDIRVQRLEFIKHLVNPTF